MSNKLNKQIINAGCMCATDAGIWFVHYVMPLLIFFDFKKKSVTFTRIIPCSEAKYPFGIYASIEFAQDKLFLFARTVKESFVYDVETDSFEELIINGCGVGSFAGSYMKDGYIYALYADGANYAKIEIGSNRVEYIHTDLVVSHIDALTRVKNKGMVCTVPSVSGVVVFEIEKGKHKEIKIDGKECVVGYADYFDGNYYVYDTSERIVIKFSESGTIIAVSRKFDMRGALITHTFDGRIILDDNYSGNTYILNQNLNVIELINTDIANSKLISPYLKGCWISYKNNTYGILKSNQIVTFCNDEFKIENLYMSEKNWKDLSLQYIERKMKINKKIMEEDELCDLSVFLNTLRLEN